MASIHIAVVAFAGEAAGHIAAMRKKVAPSIIAAGKLEG